VFILPFLVLAIAEARGYSNLVRYTAPFTLPQFAQIVGALGTFVLTGGLLYLYRRQTQILDEEKRQTEFQAQALLMIEDFQIISPQQVEEYCEEGDIEFWDHLAHADLVEVELSNFGRAPADELRIEAVLHGDEIGWETQGPLVKGDWQTAVNKMVGNPMDVIRLNDRGAPLGTDERNVTYTCSLHAMKEEIEEQWDTELPIDDRVEARVPKFLSASEILWLLQDRGENGVDAGIRIWYRDGTGDREPINLQFATAESPKVADFQTAVMKGRPLMSEEVPDYEKWWDG
jgi:hypothetical protein